MIGKQFFLKIFLPAMLTIVLFVLILFLIIIPNSEDNIMNVKKEMIKELTNSAWNIINESHRLQTEKNISEDSAKTIAYNLINHLKYGEDNKDYFWITDLEPVMIMHPFRMDLEGKNLSDFKDPHGKKLFVECVNVVKKNKSGYVDYMWQWKDDSLHIVPKLSYVRIFEPWQWVVGTGIYIEDVRIEISKLTRKIFIISLIIFFLVIVLLFFILRSSLNIEKQKKHAENKLLESKERYKALVNATTEGILLIIDNKPAYFNSLFTHFTGLNSEKIEKLSLLEINKLLKIEDITNNSEYGKKEIILENGKSILINFSSISISGRSGTIYILKDLSVKSRESEFENSLKVGYFKILLKSRSKFVKFNTEFQKLSSYNYDELINISPFSILKNSKMLKEINEEFNRQGKINSRIIEIIDSKNNNISLFASLWLSKDENSNNYCEGIVMNITDWISNYNFISNQLEELTLHYSLLFNEIKDFCNISEIINIETVKNNIVDYFRKNNTDLILIGDIENNIIGYTYRDFIFEKYSKTSNTDLYSYLISPLNYIDASDSIFNTLDTLKNTKHKYLFIKNKESQRVEYINGQLILELLKKWPAYILQKIKNTNTIDELKQINYSLPTLFKGMLTGYNASKILSNALSVISDEITIKIINKAIEQIGNPPAKFSFIVMGSMGRNERTFITDQDNAIIYDDSENNELTKKYFSQLAEIVCENLHKIGFTYCPGNIMAKIPEWCQPLSKWKSYFSNWIQQPNPQNILDISIFFDFKHLYGEEKIAKDLRNHINQSLNSNSPLLFQMAKSILNFKLPISTFGALTTENTGSNYGKFNIKNIQGPLVMLARLYSLKSKSNSNNTLDRIKQLPSSSNISIEKANEMAEEYNYALFLRLRNIIDNQNQLSDNYLDLSSLSQIEETILKKVVGQISSHISILNSDFKGIAELR